MSGFLPRIRPHKVFLGRRARDGLQESAQRRIFERAQGGRLGRAQEGFKD
jgi:hypothetical protein